MNKARQSRNTWSKRMPAIAVLVVSAMLCVLAVVYRGVEVTQVSVDDGGIWVTNQDRKLLGHLNYDSLARCPSSPRPSTSVRPAAT